MANVNIKKTKKKRQRLDWKIKLHVRMYIRLNPSSRAVRWFEINGTRKIEELISKFRKLML